MKKALRLLFKNLFAAQVVFAISCSTVQAQSFKSEHNLLGVNVIGGYASNSGFVGSVPVFYEHGTRLLKERVGVGGYTSLYTNPNNDTDLTLGGRVALHPFKTERWDLHIGTGLGYGFLITGDQADNGFRIDPFLGARYYIANKFGLEVVAARYGRYGRSNNIQIGLGVNSRF